MKKINGIMDNLSKFLVLTAVLLLFACVVLVNISVLLRYVFSISFQWTEELARYLHIGIVILLCGPLIWQQGHINMDLVIQKTKGKTRKIIRIAGELFMLFLITYTFVKSCGWVNQLIEYRIKTFSTVFEQWQPSMIIPVGFGIAVLFNVVLLVKEISEFNKEDEVIQDNVMAEAEEFFQHSQQIGGENNGGGK